MSQPNPSELQKASENVNPDQLADNLDKDNHNNQAAKPRPLDSQKTPRLLMTHFVRINKYLTSAHHVTN